MSHDNVLTPWPEDWQQRKEEILDQLLQRWERVWEQGEDLSPQHLCPDGPEALRHELAEGIACLKAFDHQFRPSAAPQAPEAQQFRAGDYEGLDDIEEGGQGKVIRAQDRHLGREVAIKLLQDHWAWSSSARQRLAQEAQITGNLEHPGIIPVYGFGYDVAGNPYYAMRYVQGERTLHDAIDHVHSLPDTPERSVAVQKLVRDFLMVCRTVDYAHSRNVIHRDLKPANIMVGDYGEVFVMDWGLAKPLPPADSKTGPVVPESAAPKMGSGPSHTVGAMGTWHYMSPEQASDAAGVGTASDIYSLGATLYHLVTGKPPLMGDTLPQMVAHLQTGWLPRPRAINPTVPPALEAICVKAMQHQPAARYASARALADDIERWLADEPVSVWREPWRVRARRWARHHRPLVTGAAAAVLVAVVTLSIAAVLLSAKQHQLHIANDALTRHNMALRKSVYTNQFLLARATWMNAAQADTILDATDADMRGIEWYHLKQLTRAPEEITLTIGGHFNKVYNARRDDITISHVDISNDAALVAVALYAGIGPDLVQKPGWNMYVYDVSAGTFLYGLNGSGWVREVRFSHDNQRLVAVVQAVPADYKFGDAIRKALERAQVDATRSWQQSLGRLSLGDQEPARPEESAPTVDEDAAVAALTTIHVWEAQTGKVLQTSTREAFAQAFHRNDTAAFAPHGTVDVKVQKDNSVRLTVSDGDTERQALLMPQPPIHAVAISPDGNTIATAGGDGGIRFWHFATGQHFGTIAIRAHTARLLRFLPDSQRIVWIGSDGIARISAAPLQPIRLSTSGELTQAHAALAITRTPDGKSVVALHQDGIVRVRDLASGQLRHELRFSASPLDPRAASSALSPDGALLAVAGSDQLRVFDIGSGRPLYSVSGVVAPVVFSSAGKSVIAVRQRRAVVDVLADDAPGSIQEETRRHARNLSQGQSWRGEAGDDRLRDAIGRRDFAKLTDGLGDKVRSGIVVIESRSGKLQHFVPYEFLGNLPLYVALHPDGNQLAVVLWSGKAIDLWDLARRTKVTHSVDVWHDSQGAKRLSFSPDGSALVITSDTRGPGYVWDTTKWRVVSSLSGHTDAITDVSYSTDGTRVVTSSLDGTVRLWDTQSGALLWTFIDKERYPVWSVTFSSNDLQLIAGAHELLIWDTRLKP